VHYDLPVGGRRLMQQVDGYDATIVSGVVTQRGGKATGARPGKLVRGAQGRNRSSVRRRARAGLGARDWPAAIDVERVTALRCHPSQISRHQTWTDHCRPGSGP
jgi:hypothetical protein